VGLSFHKALIGFQGRGVNPVLKLDFSAPRPPWRHYFSRELGMEVRVSGSLVLSGMNKWYDTNQLCIRSRPLNVDKRANR
jgi:hypothetical protein